jgi:Protein of unknown function (DUF4241)
LGKAVLERRAFLRLLGGASAGVATLGTGAVGLGVGLGLGGCASDDPPAGSAGRTLDPPDFAAMFQPGVRYRLDENIGGGEAVVEVDDVGDLYLATGRLVATDPWWVSAGGDAAFTLSVLPGRYPVAVSFARLDRSDPPPLIPRLGAAARLTIRDEPARTREMALRPGENLADLGPGEFYGFAVDAAVGAFLDESAVAPLSRRVEQLEEPEEFESDEMNTATINGEAVNIVLDQATGLNVVAFPCGMGDGTYPVWIGRTSAGDPTCFIADLEILSRHTSGPITD